MIDETLDENWMTPELEAEGRRIYVSDILYKGIKYIMGYLKEYKVQKEENFRSNPLEIHVKVWYDLPRGVETDDLELIVIKTEERRKFAMRVMLSAIKYIMGYLKGYKMEIEQNFDYNPLEIHMKVWYKEEERPKEIV